MEITKEHIILLQAMASSFLELEPDWKATPIFDKTYPYGNKYYQEDVLELLGISIDESLGDYTKEDIKKATRLQHELPEVLKKIILEYTISE